MSTLIAEMKTINAKETEVKKFYENGKNFLHFGFNERFDYDSAIQATNTWRAYCEKEPQTKFVHIWDCRGMKGYDNKAKDLWMKYLQDHAEQTAKIIMISDNIIVRGAARIMSKFASHELAVYKTLQEMTEQEL